MTFASPSPSSVLRAPAAGPPSGAIGRFARAKGISAGMALFDAWARLRHRARLGMRVRGLDHVTIPCRDLAVAERFYIGVLGARVLLRVDEAFLRRMGRREDADKGAIHTSVVFSGGARLDLFLQNEGQPPALAGHPHTAMAVPPSELMRWKGRLTAAGVPTVGPTRLGPPGQASLYFNDPFGNHLELVTRGFVPEIPAGAPDMTKLTYTWDAR